MNLPLKARHDRYGSTYTRGIYINSQDGYDLSEAMEANNTRYNRLVYDADSGLTGDICADIG